MLEPCSSSQFETVSCIFATIFLKLTLNNVSQISRYLGASHVVQWRKVRGVGRLRNISFGIFQDGSEEQIRMEWFTLKTALSLISEFCLKMDWCLRIEELANWIL